MNSRVWRIDPYLLMLVSTVGLASILPMRGAAAAILGHATDLAIALLFFLHGAKLSRAAILQGVRAWRVHATVLAATFVMFPVYGVGLRAIADTWLNPAVGAGLLLLCIMPSTVQSSIALTALARGNVSAAVCSASLSSVLGVFVTPALAAVLLNGTVGGISSGVVLKIALQLLLPFVLGHLARPLLKGILDRHKMLVARFDRGSILLVVYTAFSAAVVEGLWSRYAPMDLAWTAVFAVVLLALALTSTMIAARGLRFSTTDEIVIVFCGSKKSLASGVPIASAIFPAAVVGPMILPLMLFHQLQLIACAVIAQRYAWRMDPVGEAPPGNSGPECVP